MIRDAWVAKFPKSESTGWRSAMGLLLAACLLASGALPGHAQDAAAATNQDRFETISESQKALRELIEQREISEERARELALEIDQIKKDRTTITASLIQAAKTEKKLTTDILNLQGQLTDLGGEELRLRGSLYERRALLAEVLAGLQRMGLNPPPAILVKPEDALSSVRSAILLGAVVPQMRAESQILLGDLLELSRLRETIAGERDRLDKTRAAQESEQARLTLLLAEKRSLEGRTIEQLNAEQQRVAQLADQAGSLEDLITSLQKRIEDEQRAAEEARLARLKAQQEAEENAKTERERNQLRRERARLRAEQQEDSRPQIAPKQAFSSLARTLTKPVGGRTISTFGSNDGLGNRAKGDTIETQPGAIVTTPADGTVLYAGPFRAYGQLLILDVGDDYHLVMAGMTNIDVTPGRFVLAGEPVGSMGNIKLASISAVAADNDNPKLYIEFRKSGEPVDPAPWWERTTAGRT